MIQINKQEIADFVHDKVYYFKDQLIYVDDMTGKLSISLLKEITAQKLGILVHYNKNIAVINKDHFNDWIYACECPRHLTEGIFHTEDCLLAKQQEYETWICNTIEKKIKRSNSFLLLNKIMKELVE